MKKYLLYMVLFLMFPSLVGAYSESIIPGGENIGIHINTPGVMIIGFYKTNGEFVKSDKELKVGDYIIGVNDILVNNIQELTNNLENNQDGKVKLMVKRYDDVFGVNINMTLVDGIYKSGLYVKDAITGLGTLTYIDPETLVYGALGHEIQESNSLHTVEVKEGFIFESEVTHIRKSIEGRAGEKNGTFRTNHVYGSIEDNTSRGIYGLYKDVLSNDRINVAKYDEILLGEASIYTVLDSNKKEEFLINIDKINGTGSNKNISFTVIDNRLIDKTGGIVQGMSGSPIIQNGKIIGAVTHVIVEKPLNGYGIFIRKMLEEGDKIKNN